MTKRRERSEIFQKVDSWLEMILKRRIVDWFLYFLIALSVLHIFLIAINHNPRLDFDESNTMQIAEQTPRNINLILSHEQNFPLYYQILHRLFFLSPNHEAVAIIFNFLIWLFSIFFFYKLLKIYFAGQKQCLFFTLIYILTSNVAYYAFYIRVYGLYNLLAIISFYSFLKYFETDRFFWLMLNFSSLAMIVLIIPSGIIAVLLFLILGVFLLKGEKGQFLFYFFLLVLTIFLAGSQFLSKADLVRTYLGTGGDYIRAHRTPLYQKPGLFLFFPTKWEFEKIVSAQFYSFLFCLFCVFLWTLFLAKKPSLEKKYLVISLPSLLFFAIAPLMRGLIGRHFIFIIAPFLTLLFCGCTFLERKIRKYVLLSMLFFFFLGNIYFYKIVSLRKFYFDDFCATLRGLDPGVFITEFYNYNALQYCPSAPRMRVVFLDNAEVFDTGPLGKLRVLLVQAKKSGNQLNYELVLGRNVLTNTKAEKVFNSAISEKNFVYFFSWQLQPVQDQIEKLLTDCFVFKEKVSSSVIVYERSPGCQTI
ncbi:MAG: hypothetical protein JW991_00750 [Candidatus Pacebacteria bacterium]|nr:hypothetical protein [Candidatus Paceibacterota bacterium]